MFMSNSKGFDVCIRALQAPSLSQSSQTNAWSNLAASDNHKYLPKTVTRKRMHHFIENTGILELDPGLTVHAFTHKIYSLTLLSAVYATIQKTVELTSPCSC